MLLIRVSTMKMMSVAVYLLVGNPGLSGEGQVYLLNPTGSSS